MSSWKDNIRKVTPYTPGEQPKISDVIKLNTNECPYPPSPLVTEMIEKMDTERFRLYPDPEASLLVNELAEYYNVKPEQVFVGVGSDDVLGMAFLTCFNSEKPILFPDITYSFYDVWAELFKIPYKTVALDEQFKINPWDFNKENGGIIFPNPNAPTAIEMPLEQVEEVIKNNPDVVVIVDEAYVDFGGHTALSLIDKYDNLLVVRTFSKSRAMAGMRIGYAFGSKELIDAIKAVKFSYNSYTMNQATIETGVAAIKDDTYFKNTVSKIIETRENAKKELKKLGFSFTDSKTNFIFATHERMPAKEIFEKLEIIIENYKKGIDIDNNNIYLDTDHLIVSGTENTQNTWMDAKVDGVAVTPRNGKAVEINSMWYNSLKIMENICKELRRKQKSKKICRTSKTNKKFF